MLVDTQECACIDPKIPVSNCKYSFYVSSHEEVIHVHCVVLNSVFFDTNTIHHTTLFTMYYVELGEGGRGCSFSHYNIIVMIET